MVGNMEIKFQKTQNLTSKNLNSRMYRGKQINKNLAFNVGDLLALIAIVSPVAGFLSCLTLRFLTSKIPNPFLT